jgi:hypothetical protein
MQLPVCTVHCLRSLDGLQHQQKLAYRKQKMLLNWALATQQPDKTKCY